MLDQSIAQTLSSYPVTSCPHIGPRHSGDSAQVSAAGPWSWNVYYDPLDAVKVFGRWPIIDTIVVGSNGPNVALRNGRDTVEGICSRGRGHFAPSRSTCSRSAHGGGGRDKQTRDAKAHHKCPSDRIR